MSVLIIPNNKAANGDNETLNQREDEQQQQKLTIYCHGA